MSIKVTCTKIHANQSNVFPEYFGYVRSNNDTSLLVSPLVVAGIVIGLVLFLSCVTIIIGSLRKDGVTDWRLQADPSYDGISYAVPGGDLRSVCTGDLTPSFECDSYPDVNVAYMDSPPCYYDCIRPGVSSIYLPLEDPPPYSLEDPCLQLEVDLNISTEEVSWTSPGSTGLLQGSHTMSSDGPQVAPPYRTWSTDIANDTLTTIDSFKNTSHQNIPLPTQNI